ncbi:MAG: hypothetical protein K9N35_02915 [Candidatus Marinimicrobia bacterium]|nr:hypothetical protein [Candidatus Neomarinimicrobiota bacterium]
MSMYLLMWTRIRYYKTPILKGQPEFGVIFMHAMKKIPQILLILCLVISCVQAQALQLQSGNIVLFSDKGDSTLLKQALNLVHQEQATYISKYDLKLEKALSVYFYYDQDGMGPRLHAVPYWSAGMTRAGSEVHIYGSNRREWLSTLKHELFHVLLAQNSVSVPVWLNEGLAQAQAGQLDWSNFVELGTATARGKLIPLVDLDVILSFNHKRASLAYGQALDATHYLIKRQGASILPYLLKNDELGFRERFRIETGESLIDFEIEWRKDLEARFWFFKISQIPGLLWALSPLVIIVAWFLKRQRGKRKIQEWEQEERLLD